MTGKKNLKKVVYLLWGPGGRSRAQNRDILLETCAPALLEAGAEKLVMLVADPAAECRSPAPKLYLGPPIDAVANLWVRTLDSRKSLEAILEREGFRPAGYLVDESVYRDYGDNRPAPPGSGPAGERPPGVVAVTLMERPQGLTREEWIRRWHGTMSPVSEEIQPRTRYVRNVVEMPLTPGAPPFEGIVEESWPSKRHVENTFLFYGAKNVWELGRNMVRILRAVSSFLDLWKIRTTMMSEYFIRTGFKPGGDR
jgi:hypothetical protein